MASHLGTADAGRNGSGQWVAEASLSGKSFRHLGARHPGMPDKKLRCHSVADNRRHGTAETAQLAVWPSSTDQHAVHKRAAVQPRICCSNAVCTDRKCGCNVITGVVAGGDGVWRDASRVRGVGNIQHRAKRKRLRAVQRLEQPQRRCSTSTHLATSYTRCALGGSLSARCRRPCTGGVSRERPVQRGACPGRGIHLMLQPCSNQNLVPAPPMLRGHAAPEPP